MPDKLELQTAQGLLEEASAGPWKTLTGEYSGDDWLIASFGTDFETNVDVHVTTDKVHASEKGAGLPS